MDLEGPTGGKHKNQRGGEEDERFREETGGGTRRRKEGRQDEQGESCQSSRVAINM